MIDVVPKLEVLFEDRVRLADLRPYGTGWIWARDKGGGSTNICLRYKENQRIKREEKRDGNTAEAGWQDEGGCLSVAAPS